ncbi:hypothetical protein H0H87_000316 [Tephrocybe sp. NHM501043]|nr:hypothetical protein H0H87_000316 [Tephrocybe sp. NHM501043]
MMTAPSRTLFCWPLTTKTGILDTQNPVSSNHRTITVVAASTSGQKAEITWIKLSPLPPSVHPTSLHLKVEDEDDTSIKRARDDQDNIDGPARRTRSRVSRDVMGQNVIERNGIKHHLVTGPSRATFPSVDPKYGQLIRPFNHFAILPCRRPQGLRHEEEEGLGTDDEGSPERFTIG